MPARIKRRVLLSPPKSLLPPTRGKFITEKRGGGEGEKVDPRIDFGRLPFPTPRSFERLSFYHPKKRVEGDYRLCITFTHNAVCQQPSPPPLRENVISSYSRTFRGLMFARFIGRASITKGMARSVLFFHFVPTSVFMVGERSESVKRWDYFFDGDDSLWTLLSRLHCRVLESRFFYRSHPPFLPVIFDLFLFYNELTN